MQVVVDLISLPAVECSLFIVLLRATFRRPIFSFASGLHIFVVGVCFRLFFILKILHVLMNVAITFGFGGLSVITWQWYVQFFAIVF